MTPEEQLYLETGNSITGAQQSQMFGKPCFKTNGKAFIAFFQQSLVCKLSGTLHTQALALEGAILFDPSGKNRPMKEWVQIPYTHQAAWSQYALAAHSNVSSLSRNKLQ